MKNPWVLGQPLSTQQRLWSDWADAQADLSLRWVHTHFVGLVVPWLKCSIFRIITAIILSHRYTNFQEFCSNNNTNLHRYHLDLCATSSAPCRLVSCTAVSCLRPSQDLESSPSQQPYFSLLTCWRWSVPLDLLGKITNYHIYTNKQPLFYKHPLPHFMGKKVTKYHTKWLQYIESLVMIAHILSEEHHFSETCIAAPLWGLLE